MTTPARRPARDRLVNALGTVVVAAIVVRTCLLAVPEQVPFGEELGSLVSDTALAYAGAWAFHYLVIVRPRREDRRRIYEVVRANLGVIYGSGDEIVRALAGAAGTHAGDVPTLEQVTAACQGVAPYGAAPLIVNQARRSSTRRGCSTSGSSWTGPRNDTNGWSGRTPSSISTS